MSKVAVVTGGTSGIGRATALALKDAGYTVYELSRRAEGVEGLHHISADVTDQQAVNDAAAQIMEAEGRIDVLVNNAGVAPLTRLNILETTEESFDRLMDINLKGTFFMNQLFANAMIGLKKQGLPDYSPRIINIGSISAYTASTNRGEYCISKAGIAMVTALFAAELGAHNIPVFEIRPGITKTDMTKAVEAKYDKFIFEDGGLPTPRWGLPEDIGEAAAALSSGAFDYSTGQVINVDGGFHIRRL